MKDRVKILAGARRIGVLTSDNRVDRDVLCIECEYNTRTLAFDGNCPECNTPVVRTLDARIFVPQQWLERVARGATVLAVGVAFFLISALFILADCLNIGPGHGSASSGVLVLFAMGLTLAGLLFVTATPPTALSERRPMSSRSCVRPLTAVVGGGFLALLAIELAGLEVSALPVAVMFSVLTSLLPLFLLRHLAFLVQFVGRASLARYLRVAGWVSLAVGASLVCGIFLFPAAIWRAPIAATATLAVIIAASLTALLVPTAITLNHAAWPEAPELPNEPERGNHPEL